MLVVGENRAAVEKDEETKVDGKPVAMSVRFDEVLEFAKDRPPQRLQDPCRRNQLNLGTHHGGNRVGSKSIDALIEKLGFHSKGLSATNTFRLGFHTGCDPELKDFIQELSCFFVLFQRSTRHKIHGGN